ncbi:GTP cyclohydrolase II [Cellulomonas wangsupingiae]|uniref:GTP cyclohydrolase II n=1 Tax=Cellulomonas wangsupingiae TaxID=2968085 RepID=A0ABY5KAE8_9CELL|nr:GTP cyclohydrolase II [Cellulomonas wangsupingiae]MCC2334255.1 GTP cyclohydrolase II [Cellulomonas wangsupingiae]MCM0641255.1 GTP cyclohydrolase II [Cellulomonas wangsupingiae]UUI65931.1 GTP cyclohydrolase II [Cellulomonas wangsupingiae]
MEHAVAPMRSAYGDSQLHCFSFGAHEEENVLCVAVDGYLTSRLVRVQSACYTAEIFRSVDCDCHEQLDQSLQRVHDQGGVVVYMLADGRGAGLLTKIRGLSLNASRGLDTFDAYRELGVEPDPRDYTRIAAVLERLGLHEVKLLTNNPRKVEGLRRHGLVVDRVPLEIPPTTESLPYLATKRQKFGHLLELVPGASEREGVDSPSPEVRD